MAYPEYQNVNQSEGITTLFTYSADVVPAFVPLLLFAVFMIATIGSFFAQKRATGRGDFFGSFAVGSWLTAIIAIALSLVTDFITLPTLIVTIVLAILSTLALYVNRMNEGF